MTSTVQEEYDEHDQGSGPIKVTILASEWGSSRGGLSTINRELAIELAKFPNVEITFFLPQCSEQDKKDALGHKINIVEAKRRAGYEELEWLNSPPEHLEIDVIVGHGVKLGRQAQFIRDSHKCKWVQVVHTDPEELGMFKSYSNPISKGEEKHKIEVELCEMSDFVVGVGPKLSEAFCSYLGGCQKNQTVFDFTPGVFDEFLSVQQVPEERKHFRILVFGRGDAEDFTLKGFDIAGKAVALLLDCHLVFVGAPNGKHEEIAKLLLDCGISASRLKVRGYVESRESLKHLFREVDMVLMPSRTEGFGLTGLEALSAGLPVLVSKNSGFGEALSKVPFGSTSVINSEDPKVWASAIKNIGDKDRQSRLEEAKALCSYYKNKYSWAKQSKDLLETMITMVHDFSSSLQRSTHSASYFPPAQISQRTEVTTEHRADSSFSCQSSTHSAVAPRLPVQMDCEIVPQNANVTPQQVLCRIADRYLQIVQPSTREELNEFVYYLHKVRETLIVDVGPGSLIVTLECRSLQILDGLWKDYCSGHLSEMAQKRLVTNDILQETGLVEVKLITTILEEDYRVCRDCFLQFPAAVSLESNQTETKDSGVKMEMEDVTSVLRDVKIDEPGPTTSDSDKGTEHSEQSELKAAADVGTTTSDSDESEYSELESADSDESEHSDNEEDDTKETGLPTETKTSPGKAEWDTFERKCLTILKQCTSEELNKMKSGLKLPLSHDSKLQKVQEPSELFFLMVEAEQLSPNKLYYLGEMLSSAGRQDLRKQLEEWDSFEQKCLSILKQCSSKDLDQMNFPLRDALPAGELEKARDPYELFTLMVNAKLLSPDNLYFLTTLLSFNKENLRRELLKDQQFEGQTRYQELAKDEVNDTVKSGYVLMIDNQRMFGNLNELKWSFIEKFGFNTEYRENLTKSEMLKLLKETAEKKFSTYDCFICVIKSYGSKDGIYGTDDEVISLQTITSLFSQNKGKPKIFLIEAVRQRGDKFPGSDPSSSPTVWEADFLINYATPETKNRFSPFGLMSAVRHVFEVYTGKEDLMSMMTRVNKLTTKSYRLYSASKMQSATLISTLTNKVFFKPVVTEYVW